MGWSLNMTGFLLAQCHTTSSLLFPDSHLFWSPHPSLILVGIAIPVWTNLSPLSFLYLFFSPTAPSLQFYGSSALVVNLILTLILIQTSGSEKTCHRSHQWSQFLSFSPTFPSLLASFDFLHLPPFSNQAVPSGFASLFFSQEICCFVFLPFCCL